MAESKKYYWLKLKRDFFKRHDIRVIEVMPNGKDYILFYLKLLCESVDHEGNLRFSDKIPYSEQMLATVTNTNVDIVRSAINVFTELGMMEIMDDGTFFMSEVAKMTGCETEWAKKKRLYREGQKGQIEDSMRTMSSSEWTLSDKSKRKSLELEKEIEKEKEYTPPKGEVYKTEFDVLWEKYPRKQGKKDALRHYTAARRSGVEFATISNGLDNYIHYIEVEGTEREYIKHGSAWFCQRSWEDDYTSSKEQKKKKDEEWRRRILEGND